MKKILIGLAAAVLLSANLGATTVVEDCQDNSTMAYYTATYSGINGCQIEDKIFSGFVVTNPGAWTTVNVVNPDPLHQGFQFGGAFVAVSPGVFTASLQYAVETVSGQSLIEDMLLGIFGASAVPVGAVVTVSENIFANPDLTGLLATLTVGGAGGGAFVFADHDSWDPVSKIYVKKDITITALGTSLPAGTIVNFSEMGQKVSQIEEEPQIPEPGTYAMMGAGLIALAAIRRRKA